ncbi:MAG: mechanosensitive ion channel family protein [Planctomycetota bacterium]
MQNAPAENNGNDAPPVDPDQMLDTVQQSLSDLWTDFLARTPFFFAGIGVLIVTWVIAKIVVYTLSRVMHPRRFSRSLRDLIKQLASVVVWVAGLTVAAVIIFPGMTPAKVLAGLGIGSVALGFAFKDIVENFLAGVLILWRFPFNPGDFVECGDAAGEVEEVTIRMTLLRCTNGELLVLPNAKLFKEPVTVRTHRPARRVTVIAGVSYDTDVDQAREIIQKAVAGCESVDKEEPIQIFAQEFASSSVNFEVTWWTGATPLDERKSRDEVISAVKRALDDAGIEIPFPYRTLTFKESLNVSRDGE